MKKEQLVHPFTVHGLAGPKFENVSLETLKAKALQHLANEGLTLGISHDTKPQSMYDNPQVYPQMFPWLFPYGYGGIGQKCHLLQYQSPLKKIIFLCIMINDSKLTSTFQ